MSTGHKGLLFNIGSSGKTFPGTVKYEHNSEESEGMTGEKKFFKQNKRKGPKMEACLKTNKEASIAVAHKNKGQSGQRGN